jgi:Protein of unknown function DUF262
MAKYWVMAPYHADRPNEWERIWQFNLANGLISLGWAKFGDISLLSEHELRELVSGKLDSFYPGASKAHIFRMLWNFYHSIDPGDFLIARQGIKKLAAVGVVASAPYYAEAKNAVGQEYPYSNHINVNWQLAPRNKQFSSTVFSRFTLYEISGDKFRKLVESDDSQKTENDLPSNPPRRVEMSTEQDGFEELDELQEEESSDTDDLEEEPQREPILNRRRIFTEKLDPKVGNLHQDWKAGDLLLDPRFQRRKVWEDARSSRLIESALLEVPLPVFYLAGNNDGTQEVIDGQQRLNAFFRFLDNDYPLSGLKELSALNGDRFRELGAQEQKQIRNYPVRTVVFKKESDESLRFQISERLNTGAMPLNAQELRNCVYRGPYNDLLHELSKDPDYMAIMGFRGPEKRMKDVEYVLRFAAFYHSSYLKYKGSMERFMNEEMKKFQKNISSDEKAELRTAFKTAVSLIRSMLGKNAFKRYYRGDSKTPNGYWEPKKFNASLFDILM